MSNNKTYPLIEGLLGDEGENAATFAVAAVLDPSPNYPDVARIIVGHARSSECSDNGGFSGSPDAIRVLARTLLQAADDVDAVLGARTSAIQGSPAGAEAVYRYCENFGRMGSLSGVFVAKVADVAAAMGRTVYLGEVLGKHSEVRAEISDETVTQVTADPAQVDPRPHRRPDDRRRGAAADPGVHRQRVEPQSRRGPRRRSLRTP